MSDFSIGDIVKTLDGKNADRLEGVVKFRTCKGALGSSGKTCDRNNCSHNPKDYTWVKWPNGSLCSYLNKELEIDVEGEDEILESMTDMLKSPEPEDRDLAADLIESIVHSRKTRKTKVSEKVVSNMTSSNPKSLMEMIKADTERATYRVVAKQINNGLRSGIVEMMKSKGASNSHVEAIAMFLETEWGAALLGTMAGHGLGYVPGIKDDPRVKRLAEEFRISSMTTVGNEIFTAAIGNLMPILTNALSALPEENIVVQNMEGHKSTSEEMEIEVETDLTLLESHMEKEEEKRMFSNGKG